jgi:DNA-binding transcriptional ArsR family regulator
METAVSKCLFLNSSFERYALNMPVPIPHTEITDPHALRALAHPLRLRLLEELAIAGPLTATELAERVGESPANCSWHLRQLARFGYIDEAPGGTGRQRPWQVVLEVRSWGTPTDDPELAQAGDAADTILMDHEYQALRAYRAWRAQESPEWRNASGSSQVIAWCTAEELDGLNKAMVDLLAPYFARVPDPESRPEGARLVRFVSWGIPARPTTRSEQAADA